jgi:hypothetical protein
MDDRSKGRGCMMQGNEWDYNRWVRETNRAGEREVGVWIEDGTRMRLGVEVQKV